MDQSFPSACCKGKVSQQATRSAYPKNASATAIRRELGTCKAGWLVSKLPKQGGQRASAVMTDVLTVCNCVSEDRAFSIMHTVQACSLLNQVQQGCSEHLRQIQAACVTCCLAETSMYSSKEQASSQKLPFTSHASNGGKLRYSKCAC